MRSKTLFLAAAAAAFSWLTVKPAAAEDDTGFVSSTLVLSRHSGEGGVRVSHVSPVLSAGYRISRSFEATVDLGATFTSSVVDGALQSSHAGPGNPLFTGRYVFLDQSGYRAGLGLGVAGPLALRGLTRRCCGIQESVVEDYNYLAATTSRGLFNPWLWELNTASVVLPVFGEARLPSAAVLRGDLALGVLIPVTGTLRRTRVGFQAGVEAARDFGWLEPGLRAQVATSSASVAEDDFAQVSIEPFLRLRVKRWFARLGALINSDAPLGFGSHSKGIWSANAGWGATF